MHSSSSPQSYQETTDIQPRRLDVGQTFLSAWRCGKQECLPHEVPSFPWPPALSFATLTFDSFMSLIRLHNVCWRAWCADDAQNSRSTHAHENMVCGGLGLGIGRRAQLAAGPGTGEER